MSELHTWEPGGWKVEVEEVSAGVYEITATSASLGTLGRKTRDPEASLIEMRSEAQERADCPDEK